MTDKNLTLPASKAHSCPACDNLMILNHRHLWEGDNTLETCTNGLCYFYDHPIYSAFVDAIQKGRKAREKVQDLTVDEYRAIQYMKESGGSFASALATAWLHGDLPNQRRIKRVFPDMLEDFIRRVNLRDEMDKKS